MTSSQELSLDRAPLDARASVHPRDSAATAAVQPRILIVEDDPSIRTLLMRGLCGRGFVVGAAASALEALDLVASARPDLMIVDVMMPGIDGISLVRRLRELPVGREIPVIFLTARKDLQTIASAIDAGARRYMTKPFGLAELVDLIRVELSR